MQFWARLLLSRAWAPLSSNKMTRDHGRFGQFWVSVKKLDEE